MNTQSPRAGDAVRVVLVVASMLLAVPLVLISLAFLGYRTSAVRAAEQEAQRAELAQRQAMQALERTRKANAGFDSADADFVKEPLPPLDRLGDTFKPVMETQYRTESTTHPTSQGSGDGSHHV